MFNEHGEKLLLRQRFFYKEPRFVELNDLKLTAWVRCPVADPSNHTPMLDDASFESTLFRVVMSPSKSTVSLYDVSIYLSFIARTMDSAQLRILDALFLNYRETS